MKFFYLILVFIIISCFFVSAAGIGGGSNSKIINAHSSLRFVAVDDGTDLEVDGTTSASEKVKIYKTVNGVEYVLGETTISFRDSLNRASDADLVDLTTDYSVASNIALLRDADVARASGNIAIYIPKIETHNAIAICEGSRSVGQVFQGCASLGVVIKEVLLFPPNGDGTYSFSSHEEAGRKYWRVDGMSGTGIQTVSINFGGGLVNQNFLEKGETIYLDEGVKEYVTNINLEYYVNVGGKDYLFLLDYVDPENRYASIYIEALNDKFVVYKNDVEEFDLDLDGKPDVIFEVVNVDFPLLFAKLVKYSTKESAVLNFDSKEKESSIQKSDVYESSGGIWSNFIKDAGLTRSQFFSIMVLGIMFMAVMVVFGKQIISMIWKAT
jgi:hypothetical protein